MTGPIQVLFYYSSYNPMKLRNPMKIELNNEQHFENSFVSVKFSNLSILLYSGKNKSEDIETFVLCQCVVFSIISILLDVKFTNSNCTRAKFIVIKIFKFQCKLKDDKSAGIERMYSLLWTHQK